MDSVSPRDWRKAKPGTHTKEVRETREELPKEVQELLLEMADQIRTIRQDMHELQATVGAFGSVTLNDLMRKSA
jgi:hypothetical protein